VAIRNQKKCGANDQEQRWPESGVKDQGTDAIWHDVVSLPFFVFFRIASGSEAGSHLFNGSNINMAPNGWRFRRLTSSAL
jgi:hypothetical protein